MLFLSLTKGGKPLAGKGIRQLKIASAALGLPQLFFLIPHQERKDTIIHIHPIFIGGTGIPGFFKQAQRLLFITVLGEEISETKDLIPAGLRL